jgi:hypothetical protein
MAVLKLPLTCRKGNRQIFVQKSFTKRLHFMRLSDTWQKGLMSPTEQLVDPLRGELSLARRHDSH